MTDPLSKTAAELTCTACGAPLASRFAKRCAPCVAAGQYAPGELEQAAADRKHADELGRRVEAARKRGDLDENYESDHAAQSPARRR